MNKLFLFISTFAILLLSNSAKALGEDPMSIIPEPVLIERAEGNFNLQSTTKIYYMKDTKAIGEYLSELFAPATGYSLEVCRQSPQSGTSNCIFLTTEGVDKSIGDEGYKLKVSPEKIVISARKPAGVFYGVQTLRQLLPPEIESPMKISNMTWTIPAVQIKDWPRFKWRGLHLDVGRHLFPVDFIKKYIDLIAYHKMNTFHWHLTEDQGWRIEIKKYPKLTEIGSKREATPLMADRFKLDGIPYQGYYTQEQVKEIVAYAGKQFITVVPEIEMPGHSIAALASYPELGCTGGPYQVSTAWGVEKDVFCAGNEKVYSFLQDVLDEVLRLFPSQYIHIGGDECPKDRWKECPQCQAKIKELGLNDEHELQSYFVKRIEKYLNSKGRSVIGWDEILEGGLAPNAAVMSWRGIKGGIKAAQLGNDVVMTPNSYCYLDYAQSKDRDSEPPAQPTVLLLDKVYSFEPIPDELSPEQSVHILGLQGNVWTEYINNPEHAEYMTFPRATALAEVAWSPKDKRDYPNFMKRLRVFNQRLDQMKVHYRDPFGEK